MKKVLLLFTLLTLITSCAFLEPSNYRNCSYNEKDGLYYNWITNEACTSINKRIERDRKKGY